MLQQKRVRGEEIQSTQVGRELLEDELATICGGGDGSTTPGDMGFGTPYNLSNLTNFLNTPPTSTNPKGSTTPQDTASKNQGLPGFSDLGSLPNLANNLLGKII